MSKTESIPVARSDNESDEMAAYTARSQWRRPEKGEWLTLQDTEAEVCEKTRPDRDPNLWVVR